MNMQVGKRFGFAILGIIALVLLSLYGYLKYHQLRTPAAETAASLVIDSHSLYRAFAADDSLASTRFLEKVIEVQGPIQQIDSSNGSMALLLATGASGLINCSMASPVPGLRVQQEILIKGKCAGYMADVLMVDCVVLTKKKND